MNIFYSFHVGIILKTVLESQDMRSNSIKNQDDNLHTFSNIAGQDLVTIFQNWQNVYFLGKFMYLQENEHLPDFNLRGQFLG